MKPFCDKLERTILQVHLVLLVLFFAQIMEDGMFRTSVGFYVKIRLATAVLLSVA